jgi:LysR family transcriptional regulator, cys regulon transcriptional activator
MKLQQLRYLVEIDKHQQNISKAATVLCTSQSGISKQIKLLEDELQLSLFNRNGKNLTGMTPDGEHILLLAKEVLDKVNDIKQVAAELRHQQGMLTIAATHTQARYVLPFAIEKFLKRYPNISLHIHQGTPEQVAKQVEQGEADIGIATEALSDCQPLIAMPCYQWNRCVIVKAGHPLATQAVTLENVAQYPIITYVLGITGRQKIDDAFAARQLTPNIVLTAVDADVIKTYVRLGLGVGIIANMALSPEQDRDLVVLDAKNLFGLSTSLIAFRKDRYLRSYIYRFIELFAPHLTEAVITQVKESGDNKARKKLLSGFAIPRYERVDELHSAQEPS